MVRAEFLLQIAVHYLLRYILEWICIHYGEIPVWTEMEGLHPPLSLFHCSVA
jgi:hypothetical protein